MGQVFTANRGIRNIDQPLTLFPPKGVAGTLSTSVKAKHLPNVYLSQFISLSRNDEEKLKRYINLVLSGKLSFNTWLEYKASNKKFFLFTDRTMLKITDANAIIDWFYDNFNCHVVYLVRHPIANALSIMKNKWGTTNSAYLSNDYFRSKYLNNEILKISEKIINTDDYFLNITLNWCLENIVPLKYSKKKFLFIYYEELVLAYPYVVQLISNYCDVNDEKEMLKIIDIPSNSSSLSEKKTVSIIGERLNKYNKFERLVARWRHEISESQERKAMELLDIFGINTYKFGSALPTTEFLHFSDLLQDL